MLRLLLLPFILLCLNLSAHASLLGERPALAPLAGPLNNSADFLPVDEAFKTSLIETDDGALLVRFIAADGYYLYRHRFSFTSDPADRVKTPEIPQGQDKHDEYFGDVEVYYGTLDIRLPLADPQAKDFVLKVGFQGCADKGLCYPPEIRRFEVGTPPAADGTVSSWTWKEIAGFFLAGLLLTFTPCVLPMLPIMSSVVLREQTGFARSLALSLAYVLPMALCFAVLGALMGLFGAGLNLQARLQSPWVLVPFSAFFVVFALAMFGLFELRLPRFIREPLDRLASRTQGGSLLNAAILGVLSSLLVSPCITAPLASGLLYISSTGDAVGGGLMLLALGLGMGTPLVLFATGGGALLPKAGSWMVTVRNTFGVLLLGVAIWLLERVLPGPVVVALWGLLAAGVAIFIGTLEFTPKTPTRKLAQLFGIVLLVYAIAAGFGALKGATDPLRPLAVYATGGSTQQAVEGRWHTFTDSQALDAALADAARSGQPVLLDWYADWCISCKVIEHEVLNNPDVQAQLTDYRLFRIDVTDGTADQRNLLNRYSLFGPPVIQLFDRFGEELLDLRVVGEIKADAFLLRLNRANAQ